MIMPAILFVTKSVKKVLIKLNYDDQLFGKAYPVPDTREIGLAPNSHARWLRGEYTIEGAVL